MADFVLQNGVHSKKILLHSLSTSVEVPVTAMRGRVNEASSWNVRGPGKSSEGNESVAWHKKASRFDYYRVAENLLFMRFVCT